MIDHEGYQIPYINKNDGTFLKKRSIRSMGLQSKSKRGNLSRDFRTDFAPQMTGTESNITRGAGNPFQ